jgi:hypothetical protein
VEGNAGERRKRDKGTKGKGEREMTTDKLNKWRRNTGKRGKRDKDRKGLKGKKK